MLLRVGGALPVRGKNFMASMAADGSADARGPFRQGAHPFLRRGQAVLRVEAVGYKRAVQPLVQHPVQDFRGVRRKLNLQQLLPHFFLSAAQIDEVIRHHAGNGQDRAPEGQKLINRLNGACAAADVIAEINNPVTGLDLLVKENDASSANSEKNLKEFLQAFKEAKFEKHLSNGALAKELQIKSFPTFLVNNRIKFSGVHTADTTNDNFCKLNKLPECGKSLSKSLA